MSKTKKFDLLPCPFCGSTKVDVSMKLRQQLGDPDRYHIACYCRDCHAMGPRVLCKGIGGRFAEFPTKEQDIQEAINKWNSIKEK